MTSRRFPPPWDIEEANASCFIVKDNNGQALAYVCFERDPGRRTAACSPATKPAGCTARAEQWPQPAVSICSNTHTCFALVLSPKIAKRIQEKRVPETTKQRFQGVGSVRPTRKPKTLPRVWELNPARIAEPRMSAVPVQEPPRTMRLVLNGRRLSSFMLRGPLTRPAIILCRLGSAYRSGRSVHWLKVKNPAALAVKREAEEEWRK
jgi:hypothetical protein